MASPRSGCALIAYLSRSVAVHAAPAALAITCALSVMAATLTAVSARQNSAPRAPQSKTPRAAASITIYVLGDVRQPGAVRLPVIPQRESRLLDAIRAARGLRRGSTLGAGANGTKSGSELSAFFGSATGSAKGALSKIPDSIAPGVAILAWSATARLLRSSGARTLSLDTLRAADTNNIALRDGDVVVVTQRPRAAVAAAGAVSNAGPFLWQSGMTAADLLRLARIQAYAVLQNAVLLRAVPRPSSSRQDTAGQTQAMSGQAMSGQATAEQFTVAPSRAERDFVMQTSAPSAIVQDAAWTTQRIALDGVALLEGTQRGPTLLPGDVLFVPAGERATTVFGAVKRPGRRDYRRGLYLLDALANAGGVSDRADVTAPLNVSAPRTTSSQFATSSGSGPTGNGPTGNGPTASGPGANLSRPSAGQDSLHRMSLRDVFQSGDVSGNSELLPGAQLIVPRRDGITVLGAIAHPQQLGSSVSSQRLMDVLQAAGGATPNALLSRIVILGGEGRTRGIVVGSSTGTSETQAGTNEQAAQAVVSANVEASLLEASLLEASLLEASLLEASLRAGDVIFVGEKNSVAVQGAVERPGAVVLHTGMTALDAVKAAGGLSLTAAPERVVVLRPAGAILYSLQADLQRVLRDGDAAQNALLQEGDIVVIPFRETRSMGDEKRARMTLSPLLSLLVGASTISDAPAPK